MIGVGLAVIAAVIIWPRQAELPLRTSDVAADAFKDATYSVDGRDVTLVNGIETEPAAPGSASQITTQFFGDDATGDLNGDGTPDTAFLLTQSGGGSGTFFYAAAAVKTASGYRGTNAILLGDRIAPQSTQIKDGQFIVNYAVREPGDPMTAQPSVGVTKRFALKGTTLIEMQK